MCTFFTSLRVQSFKRFAGVGADNPLRFMDCGVVIVVTPPFRHDLNSHVGVHAELGDGQPSPPQRFNPLMGPLYDVLNLSTAKPVGGLL